MWVNTGCRWFEPSRGSQKRNQGFILGFFFVSFFTATNHCCLHRKQQEFAVVGIFKSAQTSSANRGSEPSRGSQTKTSSISYSFLFLFVLLGSNQLQPILNSLFAALAASLTAYSRCRLRHEVLRTSREYALLPPQAATGLIQVVFFILIAFFVRAQQGEPKKEPRNSFLGSFFRFYLMAMNHLLFALQTAKFAVVCIYKSAQTSSANGGSEPSTHLH